jgi:flavodoxin
MQIKPVAIFRSSLAQPTWEKAMRCLVVYHSLSGNTRKVAEQAAKHLGADIAEVRTSRYRPGVLGFLRAGHDSWAGRLPPIEVGGGSAETYDFVLVMAPVWVGRASTPIRAYLEQNRGKLRSAAFLLTCGNSAPPRAFEEMSRLSGVKAEAVFSLRERDIKAQAELPPAVTSFLSAVKLKRAA